MHLQNGLTKFSHVLLILLIKYVEDFAVAYEIRAWMIPQSAIKESIDLVVCIFQHFHSYSAHTACITLLAILFIYTSLFWFICKLLPLDECLHVSTWMAGGCVRVFISMSSTFCRKRTKTYSTFFGIHAIPNGNHLECASAQTFLVWCEKESHQRCAWINTVSRHKHSKYSFCAQFGSMFITWWCFCLLFTRMDYIHSPLSSTFVFIAYTLHTRELFISWNTICLVDAHNTYRVKL